MPEITWDPTAGRYRLGGRFISRTAVRTALEESLGNLTKLTDTLADDLRSGRMSLTEWKSEMRDITKQVVMAGHQLAKGGRAQMTPEDYLAVARDVKRQYVFLESWTQQIEGGLNVSEGRARQYLRAGRSSFLEREAEEMERRGFLARNILRPGESCAECIAESDKGLVAPRFIVPVGQRQCRGNCRCVLAFERAA